MIHATKTNVSLMTVKTLKLEPICTDSKTSRNTSFNIYLQLNFATFVSGKTKPKTHKKTQTKPTKQLLE